MDSQSSLDVRSMETPHLDINHLPLADVDFQFKDNVSPSHLLKHQYWSKDKFLNHNDEIHLWESNFPKYLFPQVYLFLEIIHSCQACYVPSQRAIVSPDQ